MDLTTFKLHGVDVDKTIQLYQQFVDGDNAVGLVYAKHTLRHASRESRERN